MGKKNSKPLVQETPTNPNNNQKEEVIVEIPIEEQVDTRVYSFMLIFNKYFYSYTTRMIKPDWSKIIKNHIQTKKPLDSFEFTRAHKNDYSVVGNFLFLNGRFGLIEKRGNEFIVFYEERAPLKIRDENGQIVGVKPCYIRRKKILPIKRNQG